jgi:cell division protein FtsL
VKTRRSAKVKGAVSTRGVAGRVAACLLIAAAIGANAWTRVEATLVAYSLSEAHAEHEDLLREQRALELELATRRAAARIEGDARRRLGLVEPDPAQVIDLPAAPPAAPTAVAKAVAR